MAYQHPITAKSEKAGRKFCAEIARWEDWFFAGPDTPERSEKCLAGFRSAEAELHRVEAECAEAWEREDAALAKARGEMTAEQENE